MLLEACSWSDVRDYLTRDNRIVIVLGAIEQHSDLSVATDVLIPLDIAKHACEAEGILLAPPVPFGISTWSLAYPGTISLRTSTLALVVTDVVSSLAGSGFRRFYVLNGHGLNRAVTPVFGEAIAGFPGASVEFYQWWELEGVRELAGELGALFGHATWAEAHPFTMLKKTRSLSPAIGPAPNLLQPPEVIRAQMGEGHGPGPLWCGEPVSARLLETAIAAFRRVLTKPCST